MGQLADLFRNRDHRYIASLICDQLSRNDLLNFRVVCKQHLELFSYWLESGNNTVWRHWGFVRGSDIMPFHRAPFRTLMFGITCMRIRNLKRVKAMTEDVLKQAESVTTGNVEKWMAHMRLVLQYFRFVSEM